MTHYKDIKNARNMPIYWSGRRRALSYASSGAEECRTTDHAQKAPARCDAMDEIKCACTKYNVVHKFDVRACVRFVGGGGGARIRRI